MFDYSSFLRRVGDWFDRHIQEDGKHDYDFSPAPEDEDDVVTRFYREG